MTSAALAWGAAMIAFSPILSLLFFLSYPKAQLVIVVTTSAFFFLCSALLAGLCWYLLDVVIGLPGGSTLWVLVPGVLSQFLFRCAFVRVYHIVEQVIQDSLERYELQHPADDNNNNNGANNSNNTNNGTRMGTDEAAVPPPREEDSDNVATGANRAAQQTPQQQLHRWARLQLELNDFACALAAATGFGGMHAILFYGTLLASETSLNRNNSGGTLFQPSCLNMPSLVVSAIMTCLFSILDILWMLLTFFGMRRRLLYDREHNNNNNNSGDDVDELEITTTASSLARMSNSRGAGNYCLLWCLVSHMAASMATLANLLTNGCVASLPLLAVVTLLTFSLYVGGVHRKFLPPQVTMRMPPNAVSTTPHTTDPYHRD